MKKFIQIMMVGAIAGLSATSAVASDAPNAEKLYSKKCKMCHKIDGKSMGPALNTMNSDAEALRSAIADGKKRMPKFGKKFSAEEIDALVVFIQAQK